MAFAESNQTGVKTSQCETIEALFATLESPLLNFALRYLKDMSAAEDVVQEAFMKLHSQFTEVREPRRWLYRTVHNLALNVQRRESRMTPLEQTTTQGEPLPETLADPQLLPDEQIALWENIGMVQLCLSKLDERSRQLIHLKFHEGLSYKQMSERTGLAVGHVGYLLHYALKNIAAELNKTGVIQ